MLAVISVLLVASCGFMAEPHPPDESVALGRTPEGDLVAQIFTCVDIEDFRLVVTEGDRSDDPSARSATYFLGDISVDYIEVRPESPGHEVVVTGDSLRFDNARPLTLTTSIGSWGYFPSLPERGRTLWRVDEDQGRLSSHRLEEFSKRTDMCLPDGARR